MESGKLRHSLAIQSATEVEGTIGNAQSVTWATITTVWGSVRPLSTKEVTNAQGIDSSTSHQITIRYYAGLTTKHRILFGSRVFNIMQIQNRNELNRTINIIASENV